MWLTIQRWFIRNIKHVFALLAVMWLCVCLAMGFVSDDFMNEHGESTTERNRALLEQMEKLAPEGQP